MKIVLQRVKEARVEVEGRTGGRSGRGLCLLVGVGKGDVEQDAEHIALKVVELRIFPDEAGKMNLSLTDIGGEVLGASQCTPAGSGEEDGAGGGHVRPLASPFGGRRCARISPLESPSRAIDRRFGYWQNHSGA